MVPDIEDGRIGEEAPDYSEALPYPQRPVGSDPRGLTARERRQRVAILVALLLILLLIGCVGFTFLRDRALPNLGLGTLLRTPSANVVEPPVYLYSITGSGASQLGRPVGVDIAADGRVYVVDFVNRRISVFANRGRYLFSFGTSGAGKLKNPVHLAVKGKEVWVSDRRRKEIVIFGLDGTYKRVYEPMGETMEWTPLAFNFTKQGGLVVTDVSNTDRHRIHIFSPEDSRTATVGETVKVVTSEEAPLGFYFPNGVAVADDGRIFVSDGDNRRVQVLGPDGAFKAFVNTSGLPRGIAIDSKKRLYVADALAHTVDVYDLNGKVITQFGERGFGPGQFNFPNDVAIDDTTGHIFVSDRENHQVQVWGWPTASIAQRLPKPRTPLGWLACLAPFLLIPPILIMRRKIRIVVTPEFVDSLIELGQLKNTERKRRLVLVAPVEDQPLYEGRIEDDVKLESYLVFEDYSESDARALADKYRIERRESMLIAMAMRAHALATNDVELRRLAIYTETRVMDVDEFVELYLRKRNDSDSA